MATRVRWVDQVRALAMILIVLGHSLGQTGEKVEPYITGYTFSMFHFVLSSLASSFHLVIHFLMGKDM